MTDTLLGFEVGSGQPVYLPLHHLAIFGMTQKSGKTKTLEAIITRAGLKAIAFITKRGEAGFTTYKTVTPYYKPRADWQFVEGLVNVALGEKVKYEPGMRSAIMKVCRGHKDLKEIQLAARGLAKTDKSAFMRAVYERLDAYLDIVIPELEKWTFAEKLDLSEGVNVMDLTGMRLETQHIVIASTIEHAFTNLDHVIVIIPEAWETIPQGKMTPVKWVAQQFVRKGAVLGNYLWLDSQDIGGIDKTPLRQCDNWIMGRMKEAHEVERILKQLLGAKISAEEIQTLPLGHFFAAIGNAVHKVYVLPAGVPEAVGIEVALGKRFPESVRDEFLNIKVMENDEMFKEKVEQLERENKGLAQTNEDLRKSNKDLVEAGQRSEAVPRLEEQLRQEKEANVALHKDLTNFETLKKVFTEIFPQNTVLPQPLQPNGNDVSALNLNMEQPAIHVQKRSMPTLTLDSTSLNGKISTLYIEGKFPKEFFTTTDLFHLFLNNGWNQDPRASKALDQFCQWGFFEKRLAGKRPEYRLRLTPEQAKEKGLIKE